MIVLFFGPLALFMKVSGNQIAMRNIVAISSLVNVILAFILGQYIGLSGIFISAILGNIIWCIIALKFINNKYLDDLSFVSDEQKMLFIMENGILKYMDLVVQLIW